MLWKSLGIIFWNFQFDRVLYNDLFLKDLHNLICLLREKWKNQLRPTIAQTGKSFTLEQLVVTKICVKHHYL